MYPNRELQRQMDMEQGRVQNNQEEIPLRSVGKGNGVSVDDAEVRRRVHYQTIFNQYDRDNDGFLDLREMKQMIRDHTCDNLPTGAAARIMQLGDQDNDGKLDFEEFYHLAVHKDSIFRQYAVKYCHYLVPPRQPVQHSDVTDGAYEDKMTFCPPPLTMVMFSIIEICFFLTDIIMNEEHKYNPNVKSYGRQTSGPVAQTFMYNPYKRDEAWRFVTYMFVHVGIMHIMMNLIVQLLLGVSLELVHHWWRVALVYLAGVAAGSMGTSIFSPNVFLAGASGGVYALITAHIATIIMNWKEMEYAVIQLFVFLCFCGTDIGASVYKHLNDPNDKIGYIAHLSGAIAGLLVGIGVLRNLEERPWERKLWWAAVTLYFALMLAGVGIHIFYPEHFLPARD